MKILFDLQHPAHLHFFRNVAQRLVREGHEVLFTGRDKDILVDLARSHDIDVEVFGVARSGLVRLGLELVQRQWRLWQIIQRFQPDVMMAIAGTYVSLIGWLGRVRTYVFYDTEHATLSNLLAYPFARCVYVPRCYRKRIRWRHVRYNGYHELAYLAPRYFQPDPTVLDEVGVVPGELFCIVRFVGWGAAHDLGRRGFSNSGKLRAVREIATRARVFISCEGPLPEELEPYRLQLDVGRVHHLMAHAALVFGESATMASEGAILGVPGIYVDPVGRGYTDEQQREYGLVHNFKPGRQNDAIERALDILTDYQRDKWRERAESLLTDKIDVNDLLYKVATTRP